MCVFKKQSQYLYLIPHVPHLLSLSPDSHLILCIYSKLFLTKFDNELAMKLALLINCNM